MQSATGRRAPLRPLVSALAGTAALVMAAIGVALLAAGERNTCTTPAGWDLVLLAAPVAIVAFLLGLARARDELGRRLTTVGLATSLLTGPLLPIGLAIWNGKYSC